MIRSLRVCLFVGIFTVCWLFNFPGLRPAEKAAAKAPNIVMIVADDAGYNDVKFDSALLTSMATNAETPNLDALASDPHTMVMRQGYSAGVLSTPARAGLLLGQAPNHFGIEENLPNTVSNTFGLPGNVQNKTLPADLKGLGYETMAVGKWHEGYISGGVNGNRPMDMGFDGFYGYLSGSRDYGKDVAASNVLLDGNTSVENTWQAPSNNNYLTDALGNKAVSYINAHAADDKPFFLYTALPAPHAPNTEYLAADYAHFSGIADATQRGIAAQMLDMDRNIGNIQNALKDPNHDGDTSDSIDGNTIFVFVNDTGAPFLSASYNSNAPFRGNKGFTYDGGIRVPYFIKAPGLTGGIYNSPVSTYDLLPTLVAAAGGDTSQLTTDGTNIMPYLTGAQSGDPHGELFWRNRTVWAVRKGNWKLEHPDPANNGTFGMYDMSFDSSELSANNKIGASDTPTKAKIAEMFRDFTGWEATLAKPLYGVSGADDHNKFDHFVFRNNLAATTNWSAASGWQESGNLAHNVTMLGDDAYANDVVEFTTRDDASYTANNDMTRMSLQTYMLNQVQFTGNFGGAAAQSGTVSGNPLLFVKSLTGQAPKIQLGASSASATGFTFNFNNEIQLLNDLTIAGDGTQNFVIGGQIRDYYEPKDPTNTTPHSVTKTGNSNLTLTANNTFAGALAILGGQVHVNGAAAAISAASKIVIGNKGTLVLDSGSISVATIDNGLPGDYNHDHQVNAADYTVWRDTFGQSGAGLAADGNGDGTVNQTDYDLWNGSFGATTGGALVVNGGVLKSINIVGNLTNLGGTFSPGLPAAPAAFGAIGGDLHEAAGTLLFDIAGTTPGTGFDQLHVGGAASLGGILSVQLSNGFAPALGQTFQFLITDGAISGAFANVSLPSLSAGKAWQLTYGPHALSLSVVAPGSVILNGDYNHNGVVDAADYVVWRDTLGSTTSLAADGNNDGSIDASDYDIWKANFGHTASGGAGAGVPEPATVWLALSAGAAMFCLRRRGGKRLS